MSLAQHGGQPFSEAIAHGTLIMVQAWRGEVRAALAAAERLQAFCAEHGFAYYAALATLFHGWSAAIAGRADAGLDELRAGVAMLDAIGVGDGGAEYLVVLADACCRVGRAPDGLEALAAARPVVRRSRLDWLWPEIWRLDGELALSAGRSRSAAARFQRAFELRAAMSLADLWQRGGRRAAARRLLGPLVARLDEGQATRDVRTARQLLRRLESNGAG